MKEEKQGYPPVSPVELDGSRYRFNPVSLVVVSIYSELVQTTWSNGNEGFN